MLEKQLKVLKKEVKKLSTPKIIKKKKKTPSPFKKINYNAPSKSQAKKSADKKKARKLSPKEQAKEKKLGALKVLIKDANDRVAEVRKDLKKA